MKRIAIVAITALALLFPDSADAAVKAGQICKKINQSATSNGKKFTCIKSGKKLIWRPSQVLQSAPTPEISTPTPSKSAEPEIELTSSSAAKLGTRCLFSGSYVGIAAGPAVCSGESGQKLWTLVTKENDSVASRAYRYVLEKYLAAPISIGIKEVGICERFEPPGGNVMTVDWYGFRKTKYISIPVNKLQNVTNLSVSIGC